MPVKENSNLDQNVSAQEASSEIAGLFSAPKLLLDTLALLTLIDSFLTVRNATPGHEPTFLLG